MRHFPCYSESRSKSLELLLFRSVVPCGGDVNDLCVLGGEEGDGELSQAEEEDGRQGGLNQISHLSCLMLFFFKS